MNPEAKRIINEINEACQKRIITGFSKKVYEALLLIPKGRITTYKEIADFLKTSPRAVGQALKRNPFLPGVPCHRVVSSTGLIGGFMGSMKKNIEKKKQLLISEGIKIKNNKIVDFEKKKFIFNTKNTKK